MFDQAAFDELVASVNELVTLKSRVAALELAVVGLESAALDKDAAIERLQAQNALLQRKLSPDGIWVQDEQRVWSFDQVRPAPAERAHHRPC